MLRRMLRRIRPGRRLLWGTLTVIILVDALVALTQTHLAPGIALHSSSTGTATPTATTGFFPFATPIAGTLPAPTGAIACQPATTHDYMTCAYTAPTNTTMAFYLCLPRGYNARQRYPLVLLLHGVGESALAQNDAVQNRGLILDQDYVNVWGAGVPSGELSVQDHWPSFIVVPQLVSPSRWVNVPGTQGSYSLPPQPTTSLAMAMTIVELVQRQYTSIDGARRYISGISMGAYGVWDAIERWPGYFAAAVPVAGAGDPAQAGALVNLPVWSFHSSNDTDVPQSADRAMIDAINAAGGHACLTIVPAPSHAIWSQVYDLQKAPNNPLYPWLFAQRLGQPAPATPTCGA